MHGSIDVVDESSIETTGLAEAYRRAAATTSRRLVFLCPDASETSTLTRTQQFIDEGYSVTVFGFRRKRYNMAYQPDWPFVPLGLTTDGKYWQRMRALLAALPVLLAHRPTLKLATAFYARNIDQLLLAIFARLIVLSPAPIAYEVLDIPPILMRRGPGPAILRLIERLCLRITRVLVVSSPAFHRGYFAAVQKYRGAWFLLENKLHPSIAEISSAQARDGKHPSARGKKPWVVGYFGLIRGEQTFDLMTRLADRLKGRVIFQFRGVLTTVNRAKFDAELKQRSNMVYLGPYVPYQDFESIYSDVDFAWAIDLENADHNSRWLLPCRFYEAGYFGVPCLAVHDFEVGSLLERHHIGWTFDDPLEESLVRFFETLDQTEYDRIRGRVRAVPADMFVANGDVARLSSMLEN